MKIIKVPVKSSSMEKKMKETTKPVAKETKAGETNGMINQGEKAKTKIHQEKQIAYGRKMKS